MFEMKFRAYKRDDERGYLIQGVAFRNDKEVKENVIGFILERINYRSYKSADFDFGTEANKLGIAFFDLLNDVFKKHGKLNEVNKVEGWIPKIASSAFRVSLRASWNVEESKWKSLTQEIEKKLGIS